MEPWRGNQLFTRDVRTAIKYVKDELRISIKTDVK
jgi:hypothetical protein